MHEHSDTSFSAYEARKRISKEWLPGFLARCLDEDTGEEGDITGRAVCPGGGRARGRYVVKEPGVVAGLSVVERLFALVNGDIVFSPRVVDGKEVAAGTEVAEVEGPVRDIWISERTSLNILQRLSGIATRVREYVSRVAGTGVRIMDTRKTCPGMRVLDKYAVWVGGGENHRMGLYDQVLVKDTHVDYLRGLGLELDVGAVRRRVPAGTLVEVEARTREEVLLLLEGDEKPDVIMLDNMSPEEMREAVRAVKAACPDIEVEASGGIGLENVRAVADTGVDRISVGELTHSVKALDIGFYLA